MNYTIKDLEEAYKAGWKADKTLYDGKVSFKKWFKELYSRTFLVKDLEKYKRITNNIEE